MDMLNCLLKCSLFIYTPIDYGCHQYESEKLPCALNGSKYRDSQLVKNKRLLQVLPSMGHLCPPSQGSENTANERMERMQGLDDGEEDPEIIFWAWHVLVLMNSQNLWLPTQALCRTGSGYTQSLQWKGLCGLAFPQGPLAVGGCWGAESLPSGYIHWWVTHGPILNSVIKKQNPKPKQKSTIGEGTCWEWGTWWAVGVGSLVGGGGGWERMRW